MLNGIEILSQENIMKTIRPIETIFFILLVATIVFFVLFLVCAEKGLQNATIRFIILFFISFIALILFLIIGEKYKPILDHVEYKVIISDEVSLNEFNSKYEIISQEGKIYTITERKLDKE